MPGQAVSTRVSEEGIQKIVTLLTEMKSTAEADAKKDTKEHDKYMCWSLENVKAKDDSIKEGKAMIKEFESKLEENAGEAATLKAEIEQLEESIKEDQDSLSAATTQRESEREAFEAEEADLKETISLLTEAIAILGEAAAVPEPMLLQVRRLITRRSAHKFDKVMQRDFFELVDSLDKVQKNKAPDLAKDASVGKVFLSRGAALAQNTEEALPAGLEDRGGAAGAKSYNAQSSSILGMLQQMKDGTEQDLKDATAAEEKAVTTFETLTESKQKQLSSSIEQDETKKGALADINMEQASLRSNHERTVKGLATDEEALVDLRKAAQVEQEEYDARTKVRSDEIKALGAALSILTTDDARANFMKTMSFMQVRSLTSASQRAAAQDKLRQRVAWNLMKVAKRHNNAVLASLAVGARTRAFDEVKQMLDKTLAQLKKQQQTDYADKESCKTDITKTENEIDDISNDKEDLTVKKTGIEDSIAGLTKQRATLHDEIAAIQASMKDAKKLRATESALYQEELDDQHLTIRLLESAMHRLQEFYVPKQASFIQLHSHNQVQQTRSEHKDLQIPGGHVLGLLREVITDAEVDLVKIESVEKEKLKDYEEFMQVSKSSDFEKQISAADLDQQIAAAKSERSDTEQALTLNAQSSDEAIKKLESYHKSCDFLLKNYEVRKSARAQEMDAINNAKAILSGASFE